MDIKTPIDQALSAKTKKHTIARQLGLILWLQAIDPKSQLSTAQNIFNNLEELHRDFYTILDAANWSPKPAPIYQVAMLKSSYLNNRWPFIPGFRSHETSPNFYIARIAGSNNQIIIEITPDETAILQVLIQQPKGSTKSAKTLTTDLELQKLIESVWANFKFRITALSLPIITRDDEFSIPLPNGETEIYQKQLEYLLRQNQDKTIEHQAWLPAKEGDVARRLRQMDMFNQDASIRGVYKDFLPKEKRPHWETLNEVELAINEDRLIGTGLLMPHGPTQYQVFTIIPDRKKEKCQLKILSLNEQTQKAELLSINNGEIQRTEWRDQVPALGQAKTYTEEDIQKAITHFESNGRIESWLKMIFETIETTEDEVTTQHFFRLIMPNQ